jgi:hypothetical protein
MNDGQFDRPVRVALGDSGNAIHIVTNTKQAVEILLYKWPSNPDSKHLAARVACAAVLDGQKPSVMARRAFEAAAKEADILVEVPMPR